MVTRAAPRAGGMIVPATAAPRGRAAARRGAPRRGRAAAAPRRGRAAAAPRRGRRRRRRRRRPAPPGAPSRGAGDGGARALLDAWADGAFGADGGGADGADRGADDGADRGAPPPSCRTSSPAPFSSSTRGAVAMLEAREVHAALLEVHAEWRRRRDAAPCAAAGPPPAAAPPPPRRRPRARTAARGARSSTRARGAACALVRRRPRARRWCCTATRCTGRTRPRPPSARRPPAAGAARCGIRGVSDWIVRRANAAAAAARRRGRRPPPHLEALEHPNRYTHHWRTPSARWRARSPRRSAPPRPRATRSACARPRACCPLVRDQIEAHASGDGLRARLSHNYWATEAAVRVGGGVGGRAAAGRRRRARAHRRARRGRARGGAAARAARGAARRAARARARVRALRALRHTARTRASTGCAPPTAAARPARRRVYTFYFHETPAHDAPRASPAPSSRRSAMGSTGSRGWRRGAPPPRRAHLRRAGEQLFARQRGKLVANPSAQENRADLAELASPSRTAGTRPRRSLQRSLALSADGASLLYATGAPPRGGGARRRQRARAGPRPLHGAAPAVPRGHRPQRLRDYHLTKALYLELSALSPHRHRVAPAAAARREMARGAATSILAHTVNAASAALAPTATPSPRRAGTSLPHARGGAHPRHRGLRDRPAAHRRALRACAPGATARTADRRYWTPRRRRRAAFLSGGPVKPPTA